MSERISWRDNGDNKTRSSENDVKPLKKLRKIKHSRNRIKTPEEIEEYTKKMEKVKHVIDGEPSLLFHRIMKLDRNDTILVVQIVSLAFLAISFSLIYAMNGIEFPTVPTPDFLSRLFVNMILGLIGIFVGIVMTHVSYLREELGIVLGKMGVGLGNYVIRLGRRMGIFLLFSIGLGVFTFLIYAINRTSCVMFYLALFMSLPASLGTYSLLRRSKNLFALSVLFLLTSTIFMQNREDDILLIILSCSFVLLYIETGEVSIRLSLYWESVREEVLEQLYRDGVLVLDKRKKIEYMIKEDRVKTRVNGKGDREKGKMHGIIKSAKEQKLEIKKITNCVFSNMFVGLLISGV
ncbi:MAG: hypothetical protein QXT63_05990, partial [Thermoplasmata archaeon]